MSRSTRLRQARKAVAAMKRLAFSTGNKKPGIAPGFYHLSAAGDPHKATGREPNTPHAEVLSHEFDS